MGLEHKGVTDMTRERQEELIEASKELYREHLGKADWHILQCSEHDPSSPVFGYHEYESRKCIDNAIAVQDLIERAENGLKVGAYS